MRRGEAEVPNRSVARPQSLGVFDWTTLRPLEDYRKGQSSLSRFFLAGLGPQHYYLKTNKNRKCDKETNQRKSVRYEK